ncbi:MAG TPA: DUF2961 domain-containing protein [Puia sp.]|jgi:cellobiose phosphorylase/phage protein U|nr:DUF2961 domain-containing protein [Puia sp.]
MKQPIIYKSVCLLLLTISVVAARSQYPAGHPWYSFSADNKECVIRNSNLPTPWLNRLGNDQFFTWVTHNGYIESYLLDPTNNGLTNPQNTSGRFYLRDAGNGSYWQINTPAAQGGEWESRVGLGYNTISNTVNGIASQATYFIPREDNVLVMIVDITNRSGQDKTLDLFGEVEWNLGDPVKSIIYRGDGRGGSQFNLYKKAYMQDNAILAKQENWRSTANCIPWPYTGYFAVSEPVTSYETIKDHFLGTGRDYDHPLEVEQGKCTNTDFWSEAEYPWGVLHNNIRLHNGDSTTLVYVLGMSRDEKKIPAMIGKYKDPHAARQALAALKAFYDRFVDSSVTVETPDKENDRMINIWTKYLWRQFWKKSLNSGDYGLGIWSYGIEGEAISTTPEDFLLPFDMDILRNSVTALLKRQVWDTTQTDIFGPGEHTMLYGDLGLTGPPVTHKGAFAVPHHHNIYELFSIYYYLLETGDWKMLDTKLPYLDGKEETVWQHIERGLTIATHGIDDRGLPKIPAHVGDWMDEFTKVSQHGNAESEMLAAEMCYLFKGFADIAQKTGHDADREGWMGVYDRMKDAVNKLAWDGQWYIRAFSDAANPFIPVGDSKGDHTIYINGQSWPILSGIASPGQTAQVLQLIRKDLMSDYGPMIFSPSYSHYNDHIGTQSIYAPGFRNACIYLRPAGWAIAAACLGDQAGLANEMYNKAAIKSREKDIDHFHCEPYTYPENYDGPDHRLKGQGEFQWNLGEGAAWMWTAYVDYILGVRPVPDGLLIQPEIPANWPGYKVKRPFRGAVYDIAVTNPGHVSSGIAAIKIDGTTIKGNILPAYADGKVHHVEVIMGTGRHADTAAITVNSLLKEMTDRNSLATYSGPAYRLIQSSSWDRARLNRSDSKNWFANKDYNNYIRKENHGDRTEYVIMDARGPGAITKWWLPRDEFLGDRIVRVYLDDDPRPVIEENYLDFIDGSSFVKWPLAFVSSDEKDVPFQYSMPVGMVKQVGSDLYLPIPFSRSCKITLDDSVFYYCIDYRMYPPGTSVASFSKAAYEKSRPEAVAAASRALLAPNDITAPLERSATLGRGQSLSIELPAGAHAIDGIYLKIDSKDNKQMNRAAVLQVVADGSRTVWSPVAEFFGGGVYARPVKNWNSEVTEAGWMISDWIMPYKSSATVILKNYGDQPVHAVLKVRSKPCAWKESSMYFHADWHEEAPLNAPPFKDWNYVEITGKGRYAGDVLTVYSTPAGWWGEGDEKIYLDGETFPSQLGTGLEDYYGYAWGVANHFNSPFIAMPSRDARGKDNWSGYSTMERIRLLDDIPFETSLKVDMEAWIVKAGVSFSVASFWYGAAGAISNVRPDTTTILRKLPDFAGIHLEESPGKQYPDPPENRQLTSKGSNGISYAGDQLDLLAWRDPAITKTYDLNGDNILGTAGYSLFGQKIAGMYGAATDTANHLPVFITGLRPGHVVSQNGGTYLSYPESRAGRYATGLIEVPGDSAGQGVVSFTIGKNAPAMFRLGVMLDNADRFNRIGQYLWVKDANGGYSGKVRLARSNRVPDWYFFDIRNAREGDVITVCGSAEKSNGVFTIGALTFDAAGGQPIDFNSLLNRMLDRESLARDPDGAWTLHHLSSYDRHSVAKDKPGWFANNDWDNFIRRDTVDGHEEDVLMDTDGPGVITRFWIAGWPNKKAHLKLYIDGETIPFWEADHPGALIGQNKEIGLPLSQRSFDRDSSLINSGAQPGHNLYAPIPFNRHLKITYDRNPLDGENGFWYNIDYRIYKAGTVVTSFSAETPIRSAANLAKTNKAFNDFMESPVAATVMEGETGVKTAPFHLVKGSSASIPLQGTGAIRRILVAIPADHFRQAVQDLRVRITFDGQPAVDLPAGFFFGCGDQPVNAATWYYKAETTGNMATYWVMPYRHAAVITLLNKGTENIDGSLTVATGQWTWTKSTMYFHAAFSKLDNYKTVAKEGTDFNYLDLRNKTGVYVGDILRVNKAVGGWWGEGDEKIYIDGSGFPDDFGTGSEDYYGYAWGHPETFNHIFNSQPIGDANFMDKGGTTVNSRDRDLDAIPFRHSLRFDMESWNWFGGPVNYAWACFWYEKG